MSFYPLNQLEKYGWESGAGLGKGEQGIKQAIKVKLKFDSAGVGHDPGEQFTHHWWDQAFNSAASNIKVVENENGVEIKKTGDCHISTKKLDKSAMKKSMLYGSFVKAATLTDGLEKHDKDDSSSDSDSDSSTAAAPHQQLTDEQLFEACGGRTAHKGARHGLKLNGKLARLAQQEAGLGDTPRNSDTDRNTTVEACDSSSSRKKCKKKKKSRSKLKHWQDVGVKLGEKDVELIENIHKMKDCRKVKKSEKRKRLGDMEKEQAGIGSIGNGVGDGNNGNECKKMKKKSSKRKDVVENNEEVSSKKRKDSGDKKAAENKVKVDTESDLKVNASENGDSKKLKKSHKRKSKDGNESADLKKKKKKLKVNVILMKILLVLLQRKRKKKQKK